MKLQRFALYSTLLALLCLTALSGAITEAGTTKQHVFSYIQGMEISGNLKDDLISSLETAFSQGIIDTDKVLVALQLVHEQGGNQPANQEVLQILVRAVDQGLPSNQLFNELTEGVARGISMSRVEQTLREWAMGMVRVNRLLGENGIQVGTSLDNIGRLEPVTVYPLIEDLTGALEQYVAYGRNIEQGEVLKSRVLYVLRRDPRIPPELVGAIQSRMGIEELQRAARQFTKD